MICPHCGSQIRDFVPSCQMCGNEIDREKFFNIYFVKGRTAFETENYDSAIVNLKKALEFKEDSSTHVKLGLSYEKKGLKNLAASEYVKAISADFSNENAHNLLVNVYLSQHKHSEIKAWYEKNIAAGNEEIAQKMIKIIDTSKRFMENTSAFIPETKKEAQAQGRIGKFVVKYLKTYALLNAVLFFGFMLIAASFLLAKFFKTDPVILLSATAFFFISAAVMFLFIRAKKKKEKKLSSESDLVEELKAVAYEENLSDK